MNLPPTLLYRFFKENIFFVIDRTIYHIKPSSGGEGILYTGTKNFGVYEGLKLSKLEELYFTNHYSELRQYGNGLIKKILSDEKEISKDYHALGEDLEFAEFVWYKILKKGDSKGLKIKPIKIQKKEAFMIDNLFQQDYFVRNGRLYSVGNGSFKAKIKNKTYNFGGNLDLNLKKIEEEYLKRIEEKIYNQLTKGQNSLLNKVGKLKEKKELINALKKGEFFDQKEKIGFKKEDLGFFVTTKARKGHQGHYILYEPNNDKYYRFEEALIGVKLIKQDGRITWREPIVINHYIHPSLPSKRHVPHQKICEGDFDYRDYVKGCDLASAIKLLLKQGERLILSGYYGRSGAHSDLTKKHFQRLEVKEFDKTEVTNEYPE